MEDIVGMWDYGIMGVSECCQLVIGYWPLATFPHWHIFALARQLFYTFRDSDAKGVNVGKAFTSFWMSAYCV